MVKDLLAFIPESWSENGKFSYCCKLIVSCSPCSGPISKSNNKHSVLSLCITCSTVVLQCYRGQAIPMEQGKIPPSVTLYSLDRSLSNFVWLISRRPLLVWKFSLNLVGWGIPPEHVEYNLSVTHCSVPFSCTRLEEKPVNKCARSMAQNAWNQARCAFWGFRQKIFTHPQYPKIPIFLHYEINFSCKTRINLYQNSYSNRKQPMGISNFR